MHGVSCGASFLSSARDGDDALSIQSAAVIRFAKERPAAKQRIAKGQGAVPRFIAPRAQDVRQFFAAQRPVRAMPSPVEVASRLQWIMKIIALGCDLVSMVA